jgi:anaerobic selenocysteine-containing dehydrogenase
MDRRTFIKLSAITGTSATIGACGVPQESIVRFVPEEDLTPGVAEWKPSVCPGCAAGCGVLARVMEADVDVERSGQRGLMKMGVVKKLEGNPAHPVSQGGLCARGQASIQITYHPDRVTQPLERTGARGSGQFKPIGWDQAIAELAAKLDEVAAMPAPRALAFLTRGRGSQRESLIGQFLARFGAPAAIPFEFFDEAVLRRANELSFGHAQLPTYDLARARFALSFGADFLGTWNSPVAHNAAYGRMRQGRSGVRGRFVQVESRMSQTGANADEWVAIRPGTDGVLALGLAHVLMRDRLRPANAAGSAASLVEGWASGLIDFSPDKVEERTGVAAGRVERLARELAELQPAVAIVGGAPLAQSNGFFTALAVNALNALLGTVGQPGGMLFTPRSPLAVEPKPSADVAPDARHSVAGLAAAIVSAPQPPVQLLLIDGVNPVFATPRAWRVREAFEKIPFIVSFGSFIDETSTLADLILPDHSFLESWVDAAPESGALVAVASVAAPAMRPLHQTRAMPDVLLDVSKRLKAPLNLPWQTFEEMLTQAFSKLPVAPGGDDAWTVVQRQGGWWGTAESNTAAGGAISGRPSPVRFAEPQFDGAAGEYPFHFQPYPSSAFVDGSLAHLPWLQELPDPLTTAMWSSWVEVNPRTAERLGVAQGDIVEIASQHGSIRAPVVVSPGIAPDLVAMPVGQGHRTFTRFASGRGVNPIEILAPVIDSATGALAWAATRVKVTRVSEANGELVVFAGAMHERPHGNEGR